VSILLQIQHQLTFLACASAQCGPILLQRQHQLTFLAFASAQHVSILLQRRSRRSLALRGASRGDLTGNNAAALSSRRLSLEKAQSRKAAGSQKALDSRQALEGRGIADGHQKPSGTTVNPVADVETGQMHLDTAMETGDMATQSRATSNNAGGFPCTF